MTQVAGVEDELLLVRAAVAAAHRRPHADPRQALDDAEQLEWPERLQQQGQACGAYILHVFHPGEEDDADSARVLGRLQLAAEGETVHARHADVEHHHVRTQRGDALLGLGGAACFVHLDPNVLERRPQELAELRHRRRPAAGAFVSPRIEKPCRKPYRQLGPELEPDSNSNGGAGRAAAAVAEPGGGPCARSRPG